MLVLMVCHAVNNAVSGRTSTRCFDGADFSRQAWLLAVTWGVLAVVLRGRGRRPRPVAEPGRARSSLGPVPEPAEHSRPLVPAQPKGVNHVRRCSDRGRLRRSLAAALFVTSTVINLISPVRFRRRDQRLRATRPAGALPSGCPWGGCSAGGPAPLLRRFRRLPSVAQRGRRWLPHRRWAESATSRQGDRVLVGARDRRPQRAGRFGAARRPGPDHPGGSLVVRRPADHRLPAG